MQLFVCCYLSFLHPFIRISITADVYVILQQIFLNTLYSTKTVRVRISRKLSAYEKKNTFSFSFYKEKYTYVRTKYDLVKR